MELDVIPTDGTGQAHYTITTTLEGAVYLLTFDYNQRADAWYMSIATEESEDIYDGIKVLANWPLLRRCSDSRRPPGELFAYSTTSDTSPPGLNDLAPGGRCILIYISSDLVPS